MIDNAPRTNMPGAGVPPAKTPPWRRIARLPGLFAILLPLIPATFFLRLPQLDNVICDPDVGGVAYSATDWMNGGGVYAHGVETKPPGSYLLFAAVFRHFGVSMEPVYMAACVYYVWTALLIFAFGAMIFGTAQGVLAAYIYAIVSTMHFAAGTCPNFETWILLPTSFAFLAIFQGSRGCRLGWFFAAGLSFAAAAAMKQQALFFILFSPMIVYFESADRERRRNLLRFAGGLAAGFAIVGGIILAVFARRGAVGPMLRALSPALNVGYMTSEPLSALLPILIKNSLLFWEYFRVAVLFVVLYFVFLPLWPKLAKKPPEREKTKLLTRPGFFTPGYASLNIWFTASLAAVVAGMKFFPHYLVLLLPPTSIMGGVFMVQIARSDQFWRTVRICALALCWVLLIRGANEEIHLAASAYQGLRNSQHQVFSPSYEGYTRDSPVPRLAVFNYRMRKLADCIRGRSAKDDTLYVWDYATALYFFAQMRAPTRHFMYFDVAVKLPSDSGRWHASEDDPRVIESRKELLRDLRARPPRYFVMFNPERTLEQMREHWTPAAPLFADLRDFYNAHYEEDAICKDDIFIVGRLRDDAPAMEDASSAVLAGAAPTE